MLEQQFQYIFSHVGNMIETDIFALKIRHRVGQLGARSLSSVPRKSACGRLFLSVYLASERLSSLVGGYIGSTISANTLYRGWLVGAALLKNNSAVHMS